ncbi:MAG: hypothetical protein KGL39_42100 [Patescibacteria group bacterium]|nr:hypothetical protein [Patescibacteria group bacterium]
MNSTQQAIAAGAEQMLLALDAAERRDETFPRRAYAFLVEFARRRDGPFSGEDVTDAAAEEGVTTADARAWGAIFQRAARNGVIRRSSTLFKRRYGHGSAAPGWERSA